MAKKRSLLTSEIFTSRLREISSVEALEIISMSTSSIFHILVCVYTYARGEKISSQSHSKIRPTSFLGEKFPKSLKVSR